MVDSWIAVTREYLSARKLETRDPASDPNGMAAVIPP
jgi:hypothetical protein